jgi:hypothetical protein
MFKRWWDAIELQLAGLSRVGVLVVTALVMRVPLFQGPLLGWRWFTKLPVEIVLALLLCMAAASGWKVVRSHGNEGPGPGEGGGLG